MADGVDRLFDEFVAAHRRGEAPDPRPLLERAGDDAPMLRRMLDTFLRSASGTTPAPDVAAMVDGWILGEPTLLTLRTSRGARVAEVVDRLVAALGVDPRTRGRLQDYYQRLETGLLDPRRVDDSVFRAIADALSVPVTRLAVWRGAEPEATEGMGAWGPEAAPSTLSYRRPEPGTPVPERLPDDPATAEPPDELDRLFGVG